MLPIPARPVVAAVDLFCGVGGLTRGLQMAKWGGSRDISIEVRAGFDLDKSCQFAYEKNNKVSFKHMDVRDIKKCDLDEYYQNADVSVLVGCAPCQPFSSLASNRQQRRTSEDDERWGMLEQFSRLVAETKPHIVSMENVPGLCRQLAYKDFVKKLEDEGYYIWRDVVQCADYGVPQRRKRLVLLASSMGDITLLPPSVVCENKTVRQAFQTLSVGIDKDSAQINYRLSKKNLQRIRASRPGESRKIWKKSLQVPCHKVHNFPEPYGRMSWDKLAPTITSQFCFYSCGRFGHPKEDRAITIREGALLQSFPKNYKLVDKRAPCDVRTLARQIGNAVPPKLGRAIGRSIISHIAQHRRAS